MRLSCFCNFDKLPCRTSKIIVYGDFGFGSFKYICEYRHNISDIDTS